MEKIEGYRPRFEPGAVYVTARVNETVPTETISSFLIRHLSGNWGDLCEDDAKANENALCDGERLLSAYTLRTRAKLWVVTEADRSATTFLYPDEY